MVGFVDKHGPWALITGASSGIGEEFAKQIAARKLNVVLVARQEKVLEKLGEKLRLEEGIQTLVVSADLSTTDGVDRTIEACKDIDIGLLVNNAGIDLHGSFFRNDKSEHAKLIAINVSAVTMLAHEFGQRLLVRGKGGIIFVSSAGRWPMAWMSTYSASKAFVSNLSYIMHAEMRPKGINILALEPGVVKTNMTDGDIDKLGFHTISPKFCVSEALIAFEQNKLRISPGKQPDEQGDEAIYESLARNGAKMKQVWGASCFEPCK